MNKLRILISTPYFMPGYKAGGPIKSLKNLTQALSTEYEFSAYTSAYDTGTTTPYPVSLNAWTKTEQGLDAFYSEKGLAHLIKSINSISKKTFDIIYLQSFFNPRYSVLVYLLFKIGFLKSKSFLIAPRGEFSPGALQIKSFKKSLYLKVLAPLYQNKTVFWHATTPLEADDIRRVFPKAQIELAENLSFVSPENRNTTVRLPHSVVFFSRISPKKNLAFALECLKLVKTPFEFHIYGTYEDQAYWQTCEKLIKELPPHIRVTVHGELLPHTVVDTLKSYELFFLPTQGENFGHVIVEALSAGLYTLLSDQTPWNDLEQNGVGKSIPLDKPEKFAAAVENYLAKAENDKVQTSQKAIDYIQNKLNTEDSLNKYRLMFAKILNRGE